MKCGLLLFACALFMNAATVCDVTAYGAKNDASARSTKAIHDAIQACAKAGGGTVYFPAGTYETGAIELASNITLNIDAGATLRFHTDLSEYPLVPGRSEGTEGWTPAPLIGGRNLQNIAITGRGTLTADNAAWVKQANEQRGSPRHVDQHSGSSREARRRFRKPTIAKPRPACVRR